VDVVLVDMAREGCLPMVRRLADFAPDIILVGLAVPETDPEGAASAKAGLTGFVRRELRLEGSSRL
jgi:hypothetical protein